MTRSYFAMSLLTLSFALVAGCVGAGMPPQETASEQGGVPLSPQQPRLQSPLHNKVAHGVTIVYMWKPNCPGCRTMTPVINALSTSLRGSARVLKIRPDRTTLIEFGIGHYPTTIVYVDGREFRRWIGPVPAATVEDAVRRAR